MQLFVRNYRSWAMRFLSLKCLLKPLKYNHTNALSPSVNYCKNVPAFSVRMISANSSVVLRFVSGGL